MPLPFLVPSAAGNTTFGSPRVGNRGTALGCRFHLQVTAAAVAMPNPEGLADGAAADDPEYGMIHYGSVLETFDAYGLCFYTKEQFTNFVLKLQWRVARFDDNSGVYVRTPGPWVAGALQAADSTGASLHVARPVPGPADPEAAVTRSRSGVAASMSGQGFVVGC